MASSKAARSTGTDTGSAEDPVLVELPVPVEVSVSVEAPVLVTPGVAAVGRPPSPRVSANAPPPTRAKMVTPAVRPFSW